MWKKLVKYVVRYLDVWFHPPLSREQAIEIAKAECERQGWHWTTRGQVERRGWSLWEARPMGPLIKGAHIEIYINVEDGTVTRTHAILY